MHFFLMCIQTASCLSHVLTLITEVLRYSSRCNYKQIRDLLDTLSTPTCRKSLCSNHFFLVSPTLCSQEYSICLSLEDTHTQLLYTLALFAPSVWSLKGADVAGRIWPLLHSCGEFPEQQNPLQREAGFGDIEIRGCSLQVYPAS